MKKLLLVAVIVMIGTLANATKCTVSGSISLFNPPVALFCDTQPRTWTAVWNPNFTEIEVIYSRSGEWWLIPVDQSFTNPKICSQAHPKKCFQLWQMFEWHDRNGNPWMDCQLQATY